MPSVLLHSKNDSHKYDCIAEIFEREISVLRLPAGATVSYDGPTVLHSGLFVEPAQVRGSDRALFFAVFRAV